MLDVPPGSTFRSCPRGGCLQGCKTLSYVEVFGGVSVSFVVELHDTRGAEPAGWEALRRAVGLRANWAWPALRTDLGLTSGLVGVVSEDDAPAGVFAGTVAGHPRLGYFDVRSPQSSAQPGWWFAPSTMDGRRSV